MQMAIDVAGFTPAEADQLRQAMGSKRSRARMEQLKVRLYEGMAERGITGAVADEIFDKMAAMAIERGKLADVAFERPEHLSERALAGIVAAIERSRPFKAAVAIAPLRSLFLSAIVIMKANNV